MGIRSTDQNSLGSHLASSYHISTVGINHRLDPATTHHNHLKQNNLDSLQPPATALACSCILITTLRTCQFTKMAEMCHYAVTARSEFLAADLPITAHSRNGMAWSLLDPTWNDQAAFYLFQKHLICWKYIHIFTHTHCMRF
jgi:hypothetical protein